MRKEIIIVILCCLVCLSCFPPYDWLFNKSYHSPPYSLRFRSTQGWSEKIMIREDNLSLIISGSLSGDSQMIFELEFKTPINNIMELSPENLHLESDHFYFLSLSRKQEQSKSFIYIIKADDPGDWGEPETIGDILKQIYAFYNVKITISHIYSKPYIIEAAWYTGCQL